MLSLTPLYTIYCETESWAKFANVLKEEIVERNLTLEKLENYLMLPSILKLYAYLGVVLGGTCKKMKIFL